MDENKKAIEELAIDFRIMENGLGSTNPVRFTFIVLL
jgi:hypothetical protein